MSASSSPAMQHEQTVPSEPALRSTLVSRNVTINGHRTSVRLEPAMWSGFQEICRRERATSHAICTTISTGKDLNTSLTAAIRVYIMMYYRHAATEDGHARAGHGQHVIGGNGLRPAALAQATTSSAANLQALQRMPVGATSSGSLNNGSSLATPALRSTSDYRRW